jgi:hypothetical protein
MAEDISSVDIKKQIRNKRSELFYVLHRDEVIERQTKYNKNNRTQINQRKQKRYSTDEEYRSKERERVKASNQVGRILKGLCHSCFSSNIDVSVPTGIPICNDCLGVKKVEKFVES